VVARKERLIEQMLEEIHGNPPPDMTARITRALHAPVAGNVQGLADSPALDGDLAQPESAPLAPVIRVAFPWHWFAAAAAAAVLVGALLAMTFSAKGDPEPGQPGIAGPGNSPAALPRAPRPDVQDPRRELPANPRENPREPAVPDLPRQPGANTQPQPGPAQPDSSPVVPPDQPDHVQNPPKPDTPPENPREHPQPPAPQDPPREPAKDPVVGGPDAPKPGPEVPKQPVPDQPSNPSGPVVEAPKPDPVPDRPPTEAPKPVPVRVATFLYQSDSARLSLRAAGETSWKEIKDIKGGQEFLSGSSLRARRPVQLDLGNGIRAWLQGDVELGISDATPSLEPLTTGDAVYIDALGCKGVVLVKRGDVSMEVSDAAMMAERSGTNLKIACLDNEVSWGESKLSAGQSASLSGKGFSREKTEGQRLREDKFIREIAKAQNLWREDFETKPGERLFSGEVDGGRVVGGQREPSIGLNFPGGHAISERSYLRVRLRVNAAATVGLQLVADENKGKFGREVTLEADHWTIVRIALVPQAEGDQRGKVGGNGGVVEKPYLNVLIAKFQATVKAKGAQLEIDWIEIGEEPQAK